MTKEKGQKKENRRLSKALTLDMLLKRRGWASLWETMSAARSVDVLLSIFTSTRARLMFFSFFTALNIRSDGAVEESPSPFRGDPPSKSPDRSQSVACAAPRR